MVNVPTGSCNPRTNSAIYRFTGKKFVLFQEVPTLLAVQWLAVQVEGTVLLAVAQIAVGVKLFQYDGWKFVPTKIQHYEGFFGPGASGLAAAHWNGTFVLGELVTLGLGGRGGMITVLFEGLGI